MDEKTKLLALFHHVHHEKDYHEVHHCGGEHRKINPKLDYNIRHCRCNKHNIDRKQAIGHDFELNEILVEFAEQCPEGGWHIESGMIKNDKSER